MNLKQLAPAAACAALVSLAAGCGGSGGSSGAEVAPLTFSGTAATGAPFDGAAVSVIDSQGNVVGTGTTGADGTYSITASGGVGPFVIQAVRDDETLVSVAGENGGTANITPITNLIAARLSASGDPTRLAAEIAADQTRLNGAAIEAKAQEMVTVLKPLLDAAGAAEDPLTGAFAADGRGADRVLDSLAITITPVSGTATNIEVVVKQVLADGDQPQPIQFSSTSSTVPTLPAVAAANLVRPGTAPLIAALLARMTECFALPAAERVDVPDTTNAGPAAIKAQVCRDIFHDADPSTFKSNGRRVGSNAGKDAFSGIYSSRATGAVFDRGTYEFTRANGDIVIGYRSTDSEGNSTTDTFVVRPDNVDAPTRLQQIGNQYNHDGGVKPYHQLRTFVNQPQSAYYSTGYALSVANTLDSSNAPIYSRVVVTTPRGGRLTLRPRTGFSLLQLARSQTDVTASSFVRLRSVYVSPSRAGEDPAAADTKLFFAPAAPSDAEIERFGNKGVWTFEYFLAANGTNVPNAIQHYRTRTRALSIGELKQRDFASLSTAAVADLVAQSAGTGHVPAPSAGLPMSWTVGAAALPPTQLTVWGFNTANGAQFNDSQNVGSTRRAATVLCVKKSALDVHCTGTTVGGASNYVSTARINGMHLFARDAAGREYAHFYATYSIGELE